MNIRPIVRDLVRIYSRRLGSRIGIAAGLNFLFFGARFRRRNRGGERRRNQTGLIPDSALTCNFIEQSVAVDRLGNSCVTVFQEPVYEPHP
jgi:hypothetical protein